MPIHKKIFAGFKKALPFITPALGLLPGGSLLTRVAGTAFGGLTQTLAGTTQALRQVVAPILPPSKFGPTRPEDVPGFQEDVDRVVGEIRRGARSRTNVTPRLKNAVDRALGSFVFGQVPARAPGPPAETRFQRYKREVLAGARSIDNVDASIVPLVTSSVKRQLAASVLRKFGPAAVTVPERLRPAPAVTSPAMAAAPRIPQFRLGAPTMPTRRVTFGEFPGAAVPRVFAEQEMESFAGVSPAIGGVPALAGIGGLVRSFAGIISRSGVGAGIRSIVAWVRGNPATAASLAVGAGLTVDQLIDEVSEKAMRKAITGGVILSRNDLKGFNRTVKVAKKLRVYARKAPRRASSRIPAHAHTVRSRR